MNKTGSALPLLALIVSLLILFFFGCGEDNFVENCSDGYYECMNRGCSLEGWTFPVYIGKPRATYKYSQADLILMGVVGVYRAEGECK